MREKCFRPMQLEEKMEDAPFSRIGWALLAYLLTGLLVQTVVLRYTAQRLPWLAEDPLFRWMLGVLGSYGASFPAFAWVLKKTKSAPAERKRPLPPLTLAEVYCMALAALYVGNWLTGLAGELLRSGAGLGSTDPVEQILSDPLPLNVLLTCVLAPVFEELMFRELILDRLRPYGDRFAVLASALFFGLLHGNLSQMLYAGMTGVLLGTVAVRTGCLWQTVLLHAMVNGVSSVLFPLAARMGPAGIMGLNILLLTAVTVGVWRMVCRFRTDSLTGVSEERRYWRTLFRSPGVLAFLLWTLLSCLSYLYRL